MHQQPIILSPALREHIHSAPILVSDDDAMTRGLYRAIFDHAGLLSIETANATDVLHICHQQPISLVISDIRNTPMNGFDLLRVLRADSFAQHIPVLIVTAASDARDMAYAHGAKGYLTKPFTPNEILLEIARLIGIQ
jgi:CheY-like chemotaxis protein